MRLPVQLVESFEDDQQNFEALQDVLTTPGDILPFLQLLTPGAIQIAVGRADVVWSSSQTATQLVVTHGLPRTPQRVLASLAHGPVGTNVTVSTGNYGATSFTLDGFAGVSLNQSLEFDWIAIG